MELDPRAAANLLEAADVDTVTEIANELAYLDATGFRKRVGAGEQMEEFYRLINKGRHGLQGDVFLKSILNKVLGGQRADEVVNRVRTNLRTRDPFIKIRSSSVEDLGRALRGEAAQVAALILGELDAAKSSRLLPLLEDDVRTEAVRVMASGEEIAPGARTRIAMAVCDRLVHVDDLEQPEDRDEQLRRVAVVLQGLSSVLCEKLLAGLMERDEESGQRVRSLMVIWDDVPKIADKSMQVALRSSDAKNLALALVDASEDVAGKIRENISERARSMLEEEAMLLSDPEHEAILEAREAILDALREMSANGELKFEKK
jgi:flagellar motor switch protein FliG